MPLMRRRDLLLRSTSALWAAALAPTGGAAWAVSANTGGELTRLIAQVGEEGLTLSYEVRFELHRDVEQMLSKGVAVVFVARAEVFEKRWYWTDRRITTATRRWRLAFQPLTRQWRLNFDGFSRPYSRLTEALEVMRQGSQWPIAERLATPTQATATWTSASSWTPVNCRAPCRSGWAGNPTGPCRLSGASTSRLSVE